MILDATDKSIKVILSEAHTTTACDIAAAWEDITTTTFTPGATDTTSNGVTAVIAVAAPAASTQRRVKEMTIYNADTVSHVVTVRYVNGASTRLLTKQTISPGQTLQYDTGYGWTVVSTPSLSLLATIASSGTTDLGSTAAQTITISGVTTITSFGSTAPNGTIKFIEFSGILTLTHHATSLILPGGASITTAAGDCAVAAHEGSGNWRVHIFSPAAGTALSANSITAQHLSASTSGFVAMVNGTVATSRSGNAETYSLKTLAGTDPTATDPVDFYFRDATAATGDYVRRRVTAATSIVIASTKTMGFTNGVAGRIYLLAVDTGSGVELGVVNCFLTPGTFFGLNEDALISPTATPGSSAGVIYTTSGQTTKPFRVIAHFDYNSGLATAGTWVTAPTKSQLHGPGTRLPGDTAQVVEDTTVTNATGSTAMPFDDTIPQSGEGDQMHLKAVTPTSPCNILHIEHFGYGNHSVNNNWITALFQDSASNALSAGAFYSAAGNALVGGKLLDHRMLANTASSTSFKIRCGGAAGATFQYLGLGGVGREFGGVMRATLRITEIVA